MELNRLTPEEVNQFNPSYDKPLVVKCDYYIKPLDQIRIITPFLNQSCAAIDSSDRFCIIYETQLTNYFSQKQPGTIELWECLSLDGIPTFTGEEGSTFDFEELKHIADSGLKNCFKRKTGRKIMINLENGEVLGPPKKLLKRPAPSNFS